MCDVVRLLLVRLIQLPSIVLILSVAMDKRVRLVSLHGRECVIYITVVRFICKNAAPVDFKTNS